MLLIFADDKSSESLKKQLDVLTKDKVGLQERKLKVYQFSENDYNIGFNTNWKSSTLNINKYFSNKEQFKVILVGLDGGIKLKQSKIVSLTKLFALIDGMPMRKAELKKQ